MSIELKPEQQRVIDLALQSGASQNPADVLDHAFEIIREQLDLADWMFEHREAISAHIETGFAQAERGELVDGDAATEDLDAIWWFIARNNRDVADRVEAEIIATCRRLARHPLMGSRRQDITLLPVRFWTLPKFSNCVVYKPDSAPLQIVAVLHGKRFLTDVLEGRSL